MWITVETRRAWAVVLAGGDGKRLQPLTQAISGEPRPKQFCPLLDGQTLLTHTRQRIRALFARDRILYALNRAHEQYYYSQELNDVDPSCLLVQPTNQGVAVAIARALRTILRRDPQATVVFLPCDHHYANCAAFRESLSSALKVVRDHPWALTLIGAEARSPEEEYGWIEPTQDCVDFPYHPVHRVVRFWEKPAEPVARALYSRGSLWNTFVMAGRASSFFDSMRDTAPGLACADDLEERSGATVDFCRDVLARVPEKLLVVRDADSGWTDPGSPRRVSEVLTSQGVAPIWPKPLRVAELPPR
jgi:mannose-1-phosphate guanylyltransferase